MSSQIYEVIFEGIFAAFMKTHLAMKIGFKCISDINEFQNSPLHHPVQVHFFCKCSESNHFWPQNWRKLSLNWLFPSSFGHKITHVKKKKSMCLQGSVIYLLHKAKLNHGSIIGSLSAANSLWWRSLGTPQRSVWNSPSLISLISVISKHK